MILAQGAESIIERDGDIVRKKRVPKSYRHKELDTKILSSRVKREFKVLEKAKALGIPVPNATLEAKEFTIILDYIEGKRLRDTLHEDVDVAKKEEYMKLLGGWIATLHANEIMHGDLTTSNVLVDTQNNMFLIDFGLSFFSARIEDKAVDIHLLEQTLISTHHELQQTLFDAFCNGYSLANDYNEVMERLEVVRSRGRKKH